MVSLPRPAPNAASRAVLGRLGVHGNLSPAMLTYIQFEPTIGIAAGRIDKLGMNIKSFKEPLTRAVREVMVPSIAQNFQSSGRPSWEPLSAGTLEIRERMGWSGGWPLILTGALERAATQQNIWTIGQNSAVVRDLPSNVWYGKIHQGGYEGSSMKSAIKKAGGDKGSALQSVLDNQRAILRGAKTKGGKIKSVKSTMSVGAPSIPARPFLAIQPEDEDRVAEIFIDWLGERINRAWPGVR